MSTAESLLTYDEAMRLLKSDKRRGESIVRRWDAGDGFIGDGFYCLWRKRIVTAVTSPEGFRII